MKILFNKNIPADVVAHFVKEGHTVHIFGGGELFNKTKPVFKMAKQAGVNEAFIHFGDIKHIIDNNRIEMFLSDDEKHSNTKVFAKYVPDTIDLSVQMKFRRVLLEQWMTVETKTGPCPICDTLHEMGWVDANRPVTYIYDNTTINGTNGTGLPPYRQAHSVVGQGRWNAPDSSCKCYKQFKSEIVPDDQVFSNMEPLVVVIPDHTQCQNH